MEELSQGSDTYSEAYIEVVFDGGREWRVQVSIECIDRIEEEIVFPIAFFDKEDEAEKYADSLRYIYDKAIFEFEIFLDGDNMT